MYHIVSPWAMNCIILHLRSHEGIIAICQPGSHGGMATENTWLDGKFQTKWIFRIYHLFFLVIMFISTENVSSMFTLCIFMSLFVFGQSPKCVKLLLHHFLVLVELFQVLNALERNVGPLRLFTMNCISQDAHLNPTTKTQSFWNEKTEKTPFFCGAMMR